MKPTPMIFRRFNVIVGVPADEAVETTGARLRGALQSRRFAAISFTHAGEVDPHQLTSGQGGPHVEQAKPHEKDRPAGDAA